jgi:uncharacterized integral membrane protein (TIGR00698 family)
MSSDNGIAALWKKEDWWAVWLGLGIIACAIAFFAAGSTLKPLAVSPPRDWTTFSAVSTHCADKWSWYVLLYLVFGAIFTVSTSIIGHSFKYYVPGFTLIYLVSVLILVVSQSQFFHQHSLEAPLVALILGLLVGNFGKLPGWFDSALRTEYYIKTGIVLLGATLPLTLIITAGPIAFLQATIVSLCTWFAMFFVATRVFKLDKRFGAVLGAGGAVCGVSASIAVGGAVKADKEHVAISISIVSLWALVMIFFLPLASNFLSLHPGVAGAWIGTSEFADAAGYAAAQTIASNSGSEAPIQTFTLMKVIGRDIWIGIWAFALSIVSCHLGAVSQIRHRLLPGLDHHEHRRGDFLGGLRYGNQASAHITDQDPQDLDLRIHVLVHRAHHAIPGIGPVRNAAVLGFHDRRRDQCAARIFPFDCRVPRLLDGCSVITPFSHQLAHLVDQGLALPHNIRPGFGGVFVEFLHQPEHLVFCQRLHDEQVEYPVFRIDMAPKRLDVFAQVPVEPADFGFDVLGVGVTRQPSLDRLSR